MTKEEYIKAKMSAGHELHFNDGVWWQNTKRGYCKPALLLDEIDTGKARPTLSKSYVGYNHRINDASKATGFWEPFVLNREVISNWSMEGLKSGNRRRRIKKGLKMNEVRVVENLEEYRSDISRLLTSTAIRNGHGNPPEYYDESKSAWWDTIMKVSKYTEFWCSFHENKLAAYICLHVMGNRVDVDGVKSDTDLLPTCPIDAILHHIITDLGERSGIDEMWYGGKSNRPTLDKFKTSYGFEVVQVPYQIKLLGGFIKLPKFINDLRNTEET